MKTLIVSLAALAAVSGTALASGSDDPSTTYYGNSATHQSESYATNSNAFAVAKAGKKKPLTAFERMNLLEAEGRNDEARSNSPARESMM